MRELEEALPRLRAAWMAGRSALEFRPAEWRDLTQGAEGEAALAALAGQAASLLFRPQPATLPEPRPLLPRLSLPTLPDALRPRLRRAMTALKTGGELDRALIELVAARGYTLHPADWLPGPRDDWAPAVYAPWIDWSTGEHPVPEVLELDADTYARIPWASRCAALARLRETDAAGAQTILVRHFSTELPERRLRLLEILQINLSEADVLFLSSLEADRSERVRALARSCLARLGHVAETAAAAELAEMIEVTRPGIVFGPRRLSFKTLKTTPQNTRCRALFGQVTFPELLKALGRSEREILEIAPTGPTEALEGFCQLVATTGSDKAIRLLLDCILEDAVAPLTSVRLLAQRLPSGERAGMAPRILRRDALPFDATLGCLGAALGKISLAALEVSPAYATLQEAAANILGNDETQRPKARWAIDAALPRLGLLLDATGAAVLLDRLAEWGISPVDPKLDILRLNAAFSPENRS